MKEPSEYTEQDFLKLNKEDFKMLKYSKELRKRKDNIESEDCNESTDNLFCKKINNSHGCDDSVKMGRSTACENSLGCKNCHACDNCFKCVDCTNLVNGLFCTGMVFRLRERDENKYWVLNRKVSKLIFEEIKKKFDY